MTKIMPMIEARKQLTALPEALVRNDELDVVEVTRRGKPVLAVLPWELYEAISETLEVMADADLMAKLRASVTEIEAGKGVPWEEVKRELSL